MVLAVMGVSLLLAAPARGDRLFSSRFAANTQGDIAIAANNSLTCVTPEPQCGPARAGTSSPLAQANNNARVMTYVDVDGDPSTFNSSSAALDLPDGARVLFAGLYFGGRLAAGAGGRPAPDPGARNTVRLQPPGDGGYQTVTAAQVDEAGQTYQGFADVTALVAASGEGAYRVADLQVGTGRNDGQMAGWALVVAYGDPDAASRNLSVFDGLQNVAGGSAVTIGLSGFLTPSSGPVNSTVGIVAYEGDLGTTGDGATIQGAAGPVALGQPLPGSPPLNATDNVFDSSISLAGASVATRAPDDRNTLGFDADLFPLPGVLGNGQSSTQVRLTTNGDVYQPGVVTIATDLFAPRIVVDKQVSAAAADPGDVLTYTLDVANGGQDGAQDVELSDVIPPNTTFVPGSLAIDGVVQTAAADADRAEVTGGTITARLGAGATGGAGGTLAAAAGTLVTFRARIDAVVPPSTTIRNRARVDFVAQTTGERDAGVESAPAETLVRSPAVNLALTKQTVSTPNPALPLNTSAYGPDDPIVFRITVTNEGSLAAPDVVVSDLLPGPMIPLGAYLEPAGPQCGEPTVCDVGTLAPGQSQSIIVGGVLPNDVTVFPAATTLTNLARVTSGGVETNPTDNTATASFDTLPVTDVVVDKAYSPAEPLAGGRVTYTITVSSKGPSVADVFAGDIIPSALEDPAVSISGGTGDCSFGELPEAPGVPLALCTIPGLEVGGQRTITLSGRLRPDSAGDEVLNVAAATPQGLESDATRPDDRAEVRFTPRRVDLAMAKTRLDEGPVPVGGETTFRLTATNEGDGTARDVTITDTVPDGLTPVGAPGDCDVSGQTVTCRVGTVAAGERAGFDLRTRAEVRAAGRTLTNRATVGTSSPDLDPSDDSAEVAVPIGPRPPAPADLAIDVTAPEGPVRVGDRTRWRVELTNRGETRADDTSVALKPQRGVVAAQIAQTEAFPATLARGQSVARTVTVVPTGRGRLRLTATTRTASTESATDNNADRAAVRVREGLTAVELSADAEPGAVAARSDVAFAIRLRNTGRYTARGLRLCQRLPDALVLRDGRVGCHRIRPIPAQGTRLIRRRAEARCRPGRVGSTLNLSGANVSRRRAIARVRISCVTPEPGTPVAPPVPRTPPVPAPVPAFPAPSATPAPGASPPGPSRSPAPGASPPRPSPSRAPSPSLAPLPVPVRPLTLNVQSSSPVLVPGQVTRFGLTLGPNRTGRPVMVTVSGRLGKGAIYRTAESVPPAPCSAVTGTFSCRIRLAPDASSQVTVRLLPEALNAPQIVRQQIALASSRSEQDNAMTVTTRLAGATATDELASEITDQPTRPLLIISLLLFALAAHVSRQRRQP